MFVSEKQLNALQAKHDALELKLNAMLKAMEDDSEEEDGEDYEALKNRIAALEDEIKELKGEDESEEDKAKAEEDEEKKEEARTKAIAMAAAKVAIEMVAKAGHEPITTNGKQQTEAKATMSLKDFNDMSISERNAYMAKGGKLKE